MESKHLFGCGLNTGANLEPPTDVFQRVRVVSGFGLAQAQERPSRRGLGFELDEFSKGLPPALVLIAVIIQRAQVPPALRPRGLRLQRFFVELDGLRNSVGLSRGVGLRRQSLKGDCTRAGRSHRNYRGHEYSGQKRHCNAFNSHYNTVAIGRLSRNTMSPNSSTAKNIQTRPS